MQCRCGLLRHDLLAPTITEMVTMCFQQGIFLTFINMHSTEAVEWRIVEETITRSIGYQVILPISNLSFLSKVIERLVADRFNKHANLYHLLPSRQSAYQQHHSTETAIIIVHHDIVHAIDARQVSVLVLLDLSAAFDTVDHDV